MKDRMVFLYKIMMRAMPSLNFSAYWKNLLDRKQTLKIKERRTPSVIKFQFSSIGACPLC
jgi:hypothetical protein